MSVVFLYLDYGRSADSHQGVESDPKALCVAEALEAVSMWVHPGDKARGKRNDKLSFMVALYTLGLPHI